LVGVMKLVGGVLDVWPAHEILRGIKTLALRMERQCANALALASTLQNSKGVARVFYPGLEAEVARTAMTRTLTRDLYGALVSIELVQDTSAAAFAFMDALRLCVRSTSLGDVFTGVLHPATASHREVAPARRRKLGIADSLVRISVGIEDVSDISADVLQALEVSSRIL
jgi:cystathionine beta-lyase/cystathionine gamma-synthase